MPKGLRKTRDKESLFGKFVWVVEKAGDDLESFVVSDADPLWLVIACMQWVLGIGKRLIIDTIQVIEESWLFVSLIINAGQLFIFGVVLMAVTILFFGIISVMGDFGTEVAKVSDDTVNSVVGGINSIGSIDIAHHHLFHISWHKLTRSSILSSGFESVDELHTVCRPYESYAGSVKLIFKWGLSSYTCPVLRYFSPTYFIYVMSPVMGWASFDWDPDGNNCHAFRHYELCSILTWGWALQFIAILLVALAFVGMYKGTIVYIVTGAVHLVVLFCLFLYHVALDISFLVGLVEKRSGEKNLWSRLRAHYTGAVKNNL